MTATFTASMTLEEQIGQVITVGFYVTTRHNKSLT